MPLVFFDRYPDGLPVNAVVIDDRLGGYQTTNHLLAQGYRRIAHLTGSAHLNIYRQRRLGYEDALLEAGLPVQLELLISSNLREAYCVKVTSQLLSLAAPPDAVFAANDFAALDCLQTLLSRGYRVLDEIGVIGFSNDFFSAVTIPALSTIDQQYEQLGWAATESVYHGRQGICRRIRPAAQPSKAPQTGTKKIYPEVSRQQRSL